MMIQRKPLEQRISDLRAECTAFVRKYVKEHNISGLPEVVTERMIYTRAAGDPLQAALDCLATQKKDLEIAERQSA
jgi:hypothetical protein